MEEAFDLGYLLSPSWGVGFRFANIYRNCSPLFSVMLNDLLNFIPEEGFKIYLTEIKGWTNFSPLVKDGLAVIKPDFYPNNYVIARGKYGYIYAYGDTRIE